MFVIHLREMSTGKINSSASDPILIGISAPEHPGNKFSIQIMDEFLAVLFHVVLSSFMDEFFVWNWKTGQLVTVRF